MSQGEFFWHFTKSSVPPLVLVAITSRSAVMVLVFNGHYAVLV